MESQLLSRQLCMGSSKSTSSLALDEHVPMGLPFVDTNGLWPSALVLVGNATHIVT
jgi:hypothetical protein